MNYKENEVIEISTEELAKKNTPEEVEEVTWQNAMKFYGKIK